MRAYRAGSREDVQHVYTGGTRRQNHIGGRTISPGDTAHYTVTIANAEGVYGGVDIAPTTRKRRSPRHKRRGGRGDRDPVPGSRPFHPRLRSPSRRYDRAATARV